jgi:hypothetical protein
MQQVAAKQRAAAESGKLKAEPEAGRPKMAPRQRGGSGEVRRMKDEGWRMKGGRHTADGRAEVGDLRPEGMKRKTT